MNSESHSEGCIGFHTDEMTCQQAIEWRKKELLNPWICWVSHNGYHCFTDINSSCLYGCGTVASNLYSGSLA